MPKKTIILIAAVIAIALITMVTYALTPRSYVILKIAPKSATLSIDGDKGRNVNRGDKVTLKPGEHTLVLSRDEFSTETIAVSIAKKETKTVMIALTPQTDAARIIINTDPDSVAIYEGYIAGKVRSNISQIETANPAYRSLPVTTQEYLIYTCLSLKNPKNPLARAVCVDLAAEGARDDALIALGKIGIDTSKEEVYIGTDSKVRPILHTDIYAIDYYHDIGTNGKPTFVIVAITALGSSSKESELVAIKDTALSKLKSSGYHLDDINLVYVNPALTKFNSSPDVSFPGVSH